jgi:hypothetical protein
MLSANAGRPCFARPRPAWPTGPMRATPPAGARGARWATPVCSARRPNGHEGAASPRIEWCQACITGAHLPSVRVEQPHASHPQQPWAAGWLGHRQHAAAPMATSLGDAPIEAPHLLRPHSHAGSARPGLAAPARRLAAPQRFKHNHNTPATAAAARRPPTPLRRRLTRSFVPGNYRLVSAGSCPRLLGSCRRPWHPLRSRLVSAVRWARLPGSCRRPLQSCRSRLASAGSCPRLSGS